MSLFTLGQSSKMLHVGFRKAGKRKVLERAAGDRVQEVEAVTGGRSGSWKFKRPGSRPKPTASVIPSP